MRAPAQILVTLAALTACASPAQAAEPGTDTLAAWDRYVADAVPRLHACGSACRGSEPGGRTVTVPGGAIHHWRGSVVVRSTTVDQVLAALMVPGTPPPQEDVLASRVLSRSGDTLRVYVKLARRSVVRVVYDTEHEVTFERRAPGLAVSRSVSVRITEAGGRNRGFLWRLNSYWRYTQQGADVRIDLESLSLSRDIPAIARPVVAPMVARIAGESIDRTLRSLERFLSR